MCRLRLHTGDVDGGGVAAGLHQSAQEDGDIGNFTALENSIVLYRVQVVSLTVFRPRLINDSEKASRANLRATDGRRHS